MPEWTEREGRERGRKHGLKVYNVHLHCVHGSKAKEGRYSTHFELVGDVGHEARNAFH